MAPAQQHCLVETAFGACGIAWSAGGVTRLQLPEADRAATEHRLRTFTGTDRPGDPPASVAAAIAALRRYFDGWPEDFAGIAIDLMETPAFECAVYAAARTIRWGEVTTYGALARQVETPDGARAIGRAMGRNPIPVIVPCHRVVASDRTGGFSAYGGTLTKEKLLWLEGIGADGAALLPGMPPATRPRD